METLAYFVVGVLIANSLPHIFHGASGKTHPTPFARPPGVGLSPAWVNALWGLFNLFAAAALYHLGIDRLPGERIPIGVVSLGFALTVLALSWWFARAARKRGDA